MIRNPTKFDANVKVLIENNQAGDPPLGVWTLQNARIVTVPAGNKTEMPLAEPAGCNVAADEIQDSCFSHLSARDGGARGRIV